MHNKKQGWGVRWCVLASLTSLGQPRRLWEKKKKVTPVYLQLPLGEHLLRPVEEQPEARRGNHEVAQRGPAVRRQVEERSSGATASPLFSESRDRRWIDAQTHGRMSGRNHFVLLRPAGRPRHAHMDPEAGGGVAVFPEQSVHRQFCPGPEARTGNLLPRQRGRLRRGVARQQERFHGKISQTCPPQTTNARFPTDSIKCFTSVRV